MEFVELNRRPSISSGSLKRCMEVIWAAGKIRDAKQLAKKSGYSIEKCDACLFILVGLDLLLKAAYAGGPCWRPRVKNWDDESTAVTLAWPGSACHPTNNTPATDCSHGDEVFDARCQRAVDVLRRWSAKNGGDWMPTWQLTRKLRGLTPREAEEVRTSLLQQGTIEVRGALQAADGGRPGDAFRLKTQPR